MRFRESVAAAVAAATLVAVSAAAASAPSRAASARQGAEWLSARQQGDGSFAQAGRADLTAEVLGAVVAGGVGGKTITRALGYIARNGRDDATRGAYTGRIVAGIVAGGGDPSDHGGTDYVAILNDQYDPSSGAYDAEQVFPNLLAANGALAAAGKLPSPAIDYIRSNACSSGGFGYDNGCARGADVDTTSWAVNVLVAAGAKSDPTVAQARAFLLSAQRGNGGFGFTKSLPTSADSTGLALSAIAALGEDARKAPWRQADGDNPVAALLGLQDGSGGFRVRAGANPNVTSTTNAVPGMARIAYPIEPGEGASTGPRTAGPQTDSERDESANEDPSEDEADAGGKDGSKPQTNTGAASPTPATPGPTASAEPLPDATPAPDVRDAAQGFTPPERQSDEGGGFPWLAVGGIGIGGAASGVGVWLLRRYGVG